MRFVCIIFLLLPLQAFAGAGGKDADGGRNHISYSVNDNSWMSLSGTTNINTFECISNADAGTGSIIADSFSGDERISFSNAVMVMKVNSFDCRNQRINRDLQNALGGRKNNEIEIRLIEAELNEEELLLYNGDFPARAIVTLNKKSVPVPISVNWIKSGINEYHFDGVARLRMSDFGIEPPSALMGLIKVNEEVDIRFRYSVKQENMLNF